MALPKSDADSLKAAILALNSAIGRRLAKPAANPTVDSVVTITATGVVGTTPKTSLGTGTVDTQPAIDALAGL